MSRPILTIALAVWALSGDALFHDYVEIQQSLKSTQPVQGLPPGPYTPETVAAIQAAIPEWCPPSVLLEAIPLPRARPRK